MQDWTVRSLLTYFDSRPKKTFSLDSTFPDTVGRICNCAGNSAVVYYTKLITEDKRFFFLIHDSSSEADPSWRLVD